VSSGGVVGSRGTIEQRFWRKVDKSDECWNWIGSGVRYGEFFVSREVGRVRSHVWSFEMYVRKLSSGERVCHRCDNGLCVRPDHLFAGTQSDNLQDAVLKGRVTGMRLTLENVRDIRARSASGHTYKQIGAAFDIHPDYISKIVRGLHWQEHKLARVAAGAELEFEDE